MSDAKNIFVKNKELRDYLNAIVHNENFTLCMAYADSEMLAFPNLNADMIRGAQLFKQMLTNLPETESPIGEPLSSGLVHEPPVPKSRQADQKPTTP